ncbi:MAG: outer membrane insertion C- signal [Cyclobacteriaceae bacterium]|nr:outer membrane insertion C- signal [Cyclobacteriaceae bacterium]
MKNIRILFVTLVLGLIGATNANAQELGIRFGNALGNKSSVAIDGIFALGKYSRIHADVSFGNGVALEALWDFLYRPIPDSPVNWYVGAGPSMYISSPFALGAAGEIGAEYRFTEIPLAVGIDYRPTLVIVEKTDFVNSFGINIRYVFGK